MKILKWVLTSEKLFKKNVDNLKEEFHLNVRYGSAGLLNGLFSLSTIWILTEAGINPILVNAIGFSVGMFIGFIASRHFVFRSKAQINAQIIRYLFAFFVSYLANIFVLQLCISVFLILPLYSQGIAISTYIILMYLASRFFVFRGK